MNIRATLLVSLVLISGIVACAQANEMPEAAVLPADEAVDKTTDEPAQGPAGEVSYTLDPEASVVRFTIGEILAGQDNIVVGANTGVQGGGTLNLDDPPSSMLTEFLIDASGFATDSNLRNRAISQFILQAGQFPVISFQPASVAGIPNELTVGESVPLEITGGLTIRGITQEVTFVGQATLVQDGRVEGIASTTITRAHFDLTIPQVPRVAGVDEGFDLEIEFVALAQ